MTPPDIQTALAKIRGQQGPSITDALAEIRKGDIGAAHGALLGAGMAGASMVEGTARLVGAEGFADRVRRRREADAEKVARGGTDAIVGSVIGGIATNVGVSMVPAAAVGRALRGASAAKRYAGILASQAPVSAAIGAAGKDMSTTEMFADLGDKVSEGNAVSRQLHSLADSTGTRALTDVALDALTAGSVDVALRGGKAAYRYFRPAPKQAPPMGQGRLLTAGTPRGGRMVDPSTGEVITTPPPPPPPRLGRGPIVTPPPARVLSPEEQAVRGWDGLAEMEPQAGSEAWWRAQGAVPPERRLPRGPLVTPPPPQGPRLVPSEPKAPKYAFNEARMPSGGRRPVAKVSDEGLLDELIEVEGRKRSAGDRSQYSWVKDENFHMTDDGRAVPMADRRGGQVSRQAKAFKNLDDLERVESEVAAELRSRGYSDDAIHEAVEARRQTLDDLRLEREGMELDEAGKGHDIVGEYELDTSFDVLAETGFAGGVPAQGVVMPKGPAGRMNTVQAVRAAQEHYGRDAVEARARAEIERRGAAGNVDMEKAAIEQAARDMVAEIPANARAGFTTAPVAGALAGAGAGAVAGVSFGDTPEERRRNSIIGAMAGAGVGGAGMVKLAKLSVRGPTKTAHPSMADPSVQRVASKISFDPKRQIVPKWDSVKRAAVQFYDQFVESAGGAEKLAAKPPAPGLKTAAKRFWTEMARTTSYVEPAALRMEEQLGPIVREVEQKGIGQAVAAYAAAKRALELVKIGHLDKGFDLGDAAATVSRMEASYPEIVSASQRLTQYYKDLLEWKWREGVISDDQYQAITKSGEYYIPFVRDFGLDKPTVMGMGSSALNKIPGVRRMREGRASSSIVDPFYQAILDTFETSRRVAKQRATNAFADMVAADPAAMSAIAREVPNPSSKAAVTAKDGTVIDVNIAGKRRYYEILDPRVARAFEALTPQTRDLGVRFLRAFGKTPLQVGVTTHPAFMLANFMRDQVSSGVRYPFALKQAGAGAVLGGAVGATDGDDDGMLIGAIAGFGAGALAPNTLRTLQAMLDVLSNTKSPVVAPAQAGAVIGALASGDEGESRLTGAAIGAAIGAGVGTAALKFGDKDIVKEWVQGGGPGHGYFARTPFEAKQVMRDLMRHPGFDMADVLTPHGWWDAITMVNRAIEQAPRLARYKYLTGSGPMPSATTIPKPEAIVSGKDISVNFERHGGSDAAKFLRDTQAFWNPAVQGLKWTARTVKDPKAWGVIGSLITAPSLALWWMNHDDPEYQKRPMAEKLMFWHIPKGDGNFWKIQKPHEIGWAFASLPEQFAQYLLDKDATRFGLAMKDVLGQVVSGVFPAPTLPKAGVEVALNYDTFRNRPIETMSDKSVLPKDRFDDRTSSFGAIVGQATGSAGIGPKKVDHAVRALTGTSGRFMAEEVGRVGRAFGLDPRGADFTPVGEDRSEFSRFTTRPGVPTDDENLVWAMFERSEQAWNSWRRRREEGDPDSIAQFEVEHEGDLDTYEVVSPVIRRMRELGRERRKVMGDRSLTKEQRDHELLLIAEESASAATDALNRLKELRQ